MPEIATGTAHSAPQFAHDHDKCVFLGPVTLEGTDADLYYCDQSGMPTVIARFSDQDSDYTSGLVLAEHDPFLSEAKRRATTRGIISDPAVS